MKHTSILLIITSIRNADVASGLARDLAFNTRHLGITFADGGPGFETLTEIRLRTLYIYGPCAQNCSVLQFISRWTAHPRDQ